MVRGEQVNPGATRRMSLVLWDMFTGSAPYRDVFLRTLDPRFLGPFMWKSALATAYGERGKAEDTFHDG